jgi:hypothetical protein
MVLACSLQKRVCAGSGREDWLFSFVNKFCVIWVNNINWYINIQQKCRKLNLIHVLFTFFKTQCSKCLPCTVMHSWRCLVKSSITCCNMLWWSTFWIHCSSENPTKIVWADKPGDHGGQFKSLNRDIIWCGNILHNLAVHDVVPTSYPSGLLLVCSQPNSAVCTYGLENFSTPCIVVYY